MVERETPVVAARTLADLAYAGEVLLPEPVRVLDGYGIHRGVLPRDIVRHRLPRPGTGE